MAVARSEKEFLVGTDFSPSSRRALRLADELGRKHGARVVVIHVVSPVYQVEGIDASAYVREARQRAERQLAKLKPQPAEALIRIGDPADELVATAKARRADLLVVGTRAQSALARWLLGSVAQRVLHAAPCPVLVVPSASKRGS